MAYCVLLKRPYCFFFMEVVQFEKSGPHHDLQEDRYKGRTKCSETFFPSLGGATLFERKSACVDYVQEAPSTGIVHQ